MDTPTALGIAADAVKSLLAQFSEGLEYSRQRGQSWSSGPLGRTDLSP